MRTRMRSLGSIAACLALFVGVAGMPQPVQAAGGGDITISGTARLAGGFPCPMPNPGGQACTATLEGVTILGSLAGRDASGNAWTLVLNAHSVDSQFTYIDDVTPDPPCVEGFGAGYLNFTAVPGPQAEAFGSYHNGAIPQAVVGASGSMLFNWRRVGPVMAFTIRDVVVNLDVNIVGPVQVINTETTSQRSNGAGTFVPNVAADKIPDCVNGDSNASANWTASVTWDFGLTAQ